MTPEERAKIITYNGTRICSWRELEADIVIALREARKDALREAAERVRDIGLMPTPGTHIKVALDGVKVCESLAKAIEALADDAQPNRTQSPNSESLQGSEASRGKSDGTEVFRRRN